MIRSAEEFVKLRTSTREEDCLKAARVQAPSEIWFEIVCKYPEMKEWVAHNKTIPPPVLEFLSKDLDRNVRYMVATRRAASEKVLLQLSNDSDESIRLAVACNPKVTEKVLTKLLQDEWERVREVANEKLAKLKEKPKTP